VSVLELSRERKKREERRMQFLDEVKFKLSLSLLD
jgi:hypothetical protein